MEPPQKFIHTFKNLSDEGKKQLFSKFLEHKKFPNSASELTPEELKNFSQHLVKMKMLFKN